MMNIKTMGLIAFLGMAALKADAQNARATTTTVKKNTHPSFQADYTVSKDLMEKTLEDKLKKAGVSKPKKYSGFCKYSAAFLSELSPNKLDLYTRVEGKKSNATVIVMVSTGYDNFVSASTDPTLSSNVINFLNNLSQDAVAMQAEIDLAAQQKVLKAAQERVAASEREKAKLAKKKEELEKEMQAEAKAQEKATQKLEQERNKLDQIKQGGE